MDSIAVGFVFSVHMKEWQDTPFPERIGKNRKSCPKWDFFNSFVCMCDTGFDVSD